MPRSKPLAKVGRALFGGTLGAAASVVAATMIATLNGTSIAWALGLTVLFLGAPIAIVGGAIVGARWTPHVAGFGASAVVDGSVRRLRDAHVGAWLLGLLGGLAVFVALFVVAATVLQLLGVFIGMLFPVLTRVVAWVALIPMIWVSVRTAARVIRSVDARIYARRVGAA